jgi:tRNA uridine 5-carboxymethylaminomethyl modification enzyme
MFTSRAEYRLQLREDNADLRLTERGRELGLVDDERWAAFEAKREAIEQETQRLNGLWVTADNALGKALQDRLDLSVSRETRALDLLRRPEISYDDLVSVPGIEPGVEDPKVAEQVEIQVRYAGYLQRQRDEIERQRQQEHQALPQELDYANVSGLSAEAIEKLGRVRPGTIGQAARIPGITPAAISLLLVHLKKAGALRKTA